MTSPNRIMIFGIPGSGKSTFSVKLAVLLNLPLHHIDRHFFVDGWQERDYEEFLTIQRALVAEDRWIFDGNATRSFEIRYARADLVLYFRFNRLLCLWRIFKRMFDKDPQILDRADGCSERISFKLIPYLWGFDKRVRKSIEKLKEKYPSAQFHELRNSKEVAQLVSSLRIQK